MHFQQPKPLGSYKSRQLGSLHIGGRGRSASQSPVFGADKTISKIGGRVPPDEKRLLNGWLILKLNIGCG